MKMTCSDCIWEVKKLKQTITIEKLVIKQFDSIEYFINHYCAIDVTTILVPLKINLLPFVWFL